MFQIVIFKNQEHWECFNYLKLFWSETWGGIVTLKLESTKQIFKEVLAMLQKCTDILMTNDHLLHLVIPSASLISAVGSQSVVPVYALPFLITSVVVPKNFIKKLVGYQERTLLQLKK